MTHLKRTISIILILASAFAFASCGKGGESRNEPVPEVTAAAEVNQQPEETADESLNDVDRALKYVDRPIEDFKAVYGEPRSSSYYESFLGDGQDGELKYDSFCVYTYKDASGETVFDIR